MNPNLLPLSFRLLRLESEPFFYLFLDIRVFRRVCEGRVALQGNEHMKYMYIRFHIDLLYLLFDARDLR